MSSESRKWMGKHALEESSIKTNFQLLKCLLGPHVHACTQCHPHVSTPGLQVRIRNCRLCYHKHCICLKGSKERQWTVHTEDLILTFLTRMPHPCWSYPPHTPQITLLKRKQIAETPRGLHSRWSAEIPKKSFCFFIKITQFTWSLLVFRGKSWFWKTWRTVF